MLNMTDFFGGLTGGNIRFTDATIDGDGPLPTSLSGPEGINGDPDGRLLQDYGLLMLLDRDTRHGPRTRVLAVITRRSAHCSLLRTHKPGSPLLPCLGRTPMPLELVPQPIVRLL